MADRMKKQGGAQANINQNRPLSIDEMGSGAQAGIML